MKFGIDKLTGSFSLDLISGFEVVSKEQKGKDIQQSQKLTIEDYCDNFRVTLSYLKATFE